ncbi:MAG: response regulator [Nitrospina sp.]|jgi:CheY-like chemotaxis protein|nr:response regulator [Nitrospina sp.]MBT5633933.1 response regulator [Nitrospina sp.]
MNEIPKDKLLIVDDNEQHCNVAKEFLEDDYDIEIALNGEEAISKIYDFNPVVILLDVRMPRLTGDELVKMIKAWRPEMIVIMVTADLSPEIERDCMQNGASICLSKPINFGFLKETIRNLLNP